MLRVFFFCLDKLQWLLTCTGAFWHRVHIVCVCCLWLCCLRTVYISDEPTLQSLESPGFIHARAVFTLTAPVCRMAEKIVKNCKFAVTLLLFILCLMISLFSLDFFYLCFFSRLASWNGSILASCSEFCESMRREFSHRLENAHRMFQAYFCHTCYVFSTLLVRKESTKNHFSWGKKIRSLWCSSLRAVVLPVAATSPFVSACIVLLIKAGSTALCCTMLPGNNVFCQSVCVCVCLCGSVGEYCSFQGLAVIYEGPQRISAL